MPAEFGLPQWVFGMRTFAFESAERLVCCYQQNGRDILATLDTRSLAFQPIDLPYICLSARITARPGQALFIGGSVDARPRRSCGSTWPAGSAPVLRRSTDLIIDPGYLSTPRADRIPHRGRPDRPRLLLPAGQPRFRRPGRRAAAAHRGKPRRAHRRASAPASTWRCSSGPAAVSPWWTSNYGGSTGYGRAYRERLKGQFGVVDVDDCVNAALYLARSGKADPARLAIHGGSAGGYTTLAALTFRKVFKAGASHYGISDIEVLAQGTHKFESRYIDSMIGPYPATRDLYYARSPIHFIDQLNCALILFQGAEDLIVLPEQSRDMFAAVRAKGLPVAYLEFPGEQHGFRQAAHIKRALEAELYFYSRVFGFPLADPIEPVEIENL